jgi:hypothetical protein
LARLEFSSIALRVACNARSAPKAHSAPLQPVPFEAFFSRMPALEVEGVVRVRTGERGRDAVMYSGDIDEKRGRK